MVELDNGYVLVATRDIQIDEETLTEYPDEWWRRATRLEIQDHAEASNKCKEDPNINCDCKNARPCNELTDRIIFSRDTIVNQTCRPPREYNGFDSNGEPRKWLMKTVANQLIIAELLEDYNMNWHGTEHRRTKRVPIGICEAATNRHLLERNMARLMNREAEERRPQEAVERRGSQVNESSASSSSSSSSSSNSSSSSLSAPSHSEEIPASAAMAAPAEPARRGVVTKKNDASAAPQVPIASSTPIVLPSDYVLPNPSLLTNTFMTSMMQKVDPNEVPTFTLHMQNDTFFLARGTLQKRMQQEHQARENIRIKEGGRKEDEKRDYRINGRYTDHNTAIRQTIKSSSESRCRSSTRELPKDPDRSRSRSRGRRDDSRSSSSYRSSDNYRDSRRQDSNNKQSSSNTPSSHQGGYKHGGPPQYQENEKDRKHTRRPSRSEEDKERHKHQEVTRIKYDAQVYNVIRKSAKEHPTRIESSGPRPAADGSNKEELRCVQYFKAGSKQDMKEYSGPLNKGQRLVIVV